MNSLKNLKNLLHKLRKDEVQSLFHFLQMNSDTIDKDFGKSLQLVRVILDNKDYTSQEIQKLIYGQVKSMAFSKLVNRLYDKVLETIILDQNLNKGKYSERGRMVFILRKKMIQIDLLILKGLRENINKELDQIIHKSNEYEIYDILIQALYSKQRYILIQGKQKELISLSEDILRAEKCWASFNLSQSIFNSITSKINIAAGGYSYKDELQDAIDLLKEKYEETDSPSIGYSYFFLAAEKAQKELNYGLAEEYFKSILNLLDSFVSVYSEFRYGSILLNIANNKIHLKELGEARDYILEAKSYFKEQPVNLSISEEIEFYILIYLSELQEAKFVIKKLLGYSRTLNIPLLFSKWQYLFGCVLFIDNEFEKAIESFNQAHEIESDKEGWNFYKRIYLLMSKIERDETDSADLSIQSLDKFMKRILKTKNVRPRLIIIVRILRKLINENFNYSIVYNSRKKYFDLLRSSDANYQWEVKSPEIIIFEDWFQAKLERRKYNLSSSVKRQFPFLQK